MPSSCSGASGGSLVPLDTAVLEAATLFYFVQNSATNSRLNLKLGDGLDEQSSACRRFASLRWQHFQLEVTIKGYSSAARM